MLPRLYSECRGSGAPALVFLHGLGASGRYWDKVAKPLEGNGHQLQFVDLLGFGRSPWPDLAYTVDDHLAALEAWRTHRWSSSAIRWGHCSPSPGRAAHRRWPVRC